MQWTATVQCSPANGGTATLSATSGMYNEGDSIYVTGTATPKAVCGWQFDGWRVVITRNDGTSVTIIDNNLQYTWWIANVTASGGPRSLAWTAYFTYNGTGKLVRSSLQPSKLIRVGDKLLRDD